MPEKKIEKPYGVWMGATLRKQNKLIGSRWLRDGREENIDRNSMAGGSVGGQEMAQSTPTN